MRIKDMLKATKMKKHNFPEDMICQAELLLQTVDEAGHGVSEKRLVEKMDELLTEKQRLLLWEIGGSCRGGETGRQAKILAQELAGKPLAEKIELMNQNEHMFETRLNEDGTITVYCYCHCLQHRFNNPDTAKLPSAYGCAAGAHLYILKTALGVKAKIKSIDYPQENDGKQHMTFTVEIIDDGQSCD